jgi:hypothetical protein
METELTQACRAGARYEVGAERHVAGSQRREGRERFAGPWSTRFRQARPERGDIRSERLIRSPGLPRQREQNRHQHVDEHRREADFVWPRRILSRLEELGGVGPSIVQLAGEIVSLSGPLPADSSNRRVVPIRRLHFTVYFSQLMRTRQISPATTARRQRPLPKLPCRQCARSNVSCSTCGSTRRDPPRPNLRSTWSGPGARHA